jgi:hypothetical protein
VTDIYESIIQSPLIAFKGERGSMRGAVSFRGHKMFHSTAVRLAQMRPILEEMNAKGMTLRKACRKLGYSKPCVYGWLKILGIRWRTSEKGQGKKLVKTGWHDAIVAGAKAGKTLEQVADSLGGVHLQNIHRFCKTNGIDWKALKKKHDEETNR